MGIVSRWDFERDQGSDPISFSNRFHYVTGPSEGV